MKTHRIAAYITSFIGYTLGVTHEIEGLENVDQKKGGVIVINHQCGLDFICNLTKYFFLDKIKHLLFF